MKTGFGSYCVNGIPEGCRHCVKGRKLVLFITGKCSRNCFYCSLSSKRKNIDAVWANERQCRGIKDAVQEVRESRATGAGITGGDPLLFLPRAIKYARALKKEFKNFHIHIYLPTFLAGKKNLKALSKCTDEVRFHPGFLAKNQSSSEMNADIEKIKSASLFWKKANIGCELPLLPEKKQETLDFIKKISPYAGFANLNEFELSDTNFNYVTKHCKLNPDTYTISKSREAGIWILAKAKKAGLKIKLHACTARTKNIYQYRNRLKLHNAIKYSKRTAEGSAVYFAVKPASMQAALKELKNLKITKFHIDKGKKQIILQEKDAVKALENKKLHLSRIEEFPTYDRTAIDIWQLD